MAWQDRQYYRDRSGAGGNPLMWLLSGSVPLFTVFDIRVRAHASLVFTAALVLLLGFGPGSTVEMRVQSVTMLFAVVLLHEFGHCFAARWVGGDANEIMLTPLGGMAMASAPRRPLPTAITVAGGPLVNILICLICAIGIYFISGFVPITPWSFRGPPRYGWFEIYNYLFWIYLLSFGLLMFNMLPVYPLDGGQLLQAILWKPLGYYRSMLVTVNVGLIGSILLLMISVATFGSIGGGILLMLIAASCLITCWQTQAMLKAEGPWAFQDEDSFDYSASAFNKSARKVSKRASRSAARRAEKLAKENDEEQKRIDAILAKVSADGMQSLTAREKKILAQATQRQRERDREMQRLRSGR